VSVGWSGYDPSSYSSLVKACVQEERRGKIEGISPFAKRRGGGKL
jgi:hypothetical protein